MAPSTDSGQDSDDHKSKVWSNNCKSSVRVLACLLFSSPLISFHCKTWAAVAENWWLVEINLLKINEILGYWVIISIFIAVFISAISPSLDGWNFLFSAFFVSENEVFLLGGERLEKLIFYLCRSVSCCPCEWVWFLWVLQHPF